MAGGSVSAAGTPEGFSSPASVVGTSPFHVIRN